MNNNQEIINIMEQENQAANDKLTKFDIAYTLTLWLVGLIALYFLNDIILLLLTGVHLSYKIYLIFVFVTLICTCDIWSKKLL